MTIIEQIRQGDILLIPIDSMPSGFVNATENETVAVGEGRDHFHNLKQALIYKTSDQTAEVQKLLGFNDTMIGYAEVRDGGKIAHELPSGKQAEHNPIDVKEGIYMLKRQREHDGVRDALVWD